MQLEMAVIAPQSECPQMTMSLTPSTATAYSTVAETPPGSGPYDGTILPALRIGAGDEQHPRLLAAGEALEERGAGGEHFPLELQKAFDDVLHVFFSGRGTMTRACPPLATGSKTGL
jgi:hypothetical protein